MARVPSTRLQAQARRLPIDIWGAVTVTAATVLFLFGLSLGGRQAPRDSPLLLGIFVAAALCVVLLVAIEPRAVDTVVPLALFGNDVVALSALGSVL